MHMYSTLSANNQATIPSVKKESARRRFASVRANSNFLLHCYTMSNPTGARELY